MIDSILRFSLFIHRIPFNTGRDRNFGIAAIEAALLLIPQMTQSTLHYAIELITISLKKFLTSCDDDKAVVSDENGLAGRIVQVHSLITYFITLELIMWSVGEHYFEREEVSFSYFSVIVHSLFYVGFYVKQQGIVDGRAGLTV